MRGFNLPFKLWNRKISSLLLGMCLHTALYSQQNYSGIVHNKKTGKPVSYATISLLNENKGIHSNEKGKFKIKGGRIIKDTLTISYPGFNKAVILPEKYHDDIIIELEPVKKLSQTISFTDSIFSKLNSFTSCGTSSFTSNGSYAQLAQHYKVEKASLLQNIKICKQPGESVFRIRIYDADPLTGAPMNDLADSVIEIKTVQKEVYINLASRNILLKGDFFVAVEWLLVPSNQYKVKVKSTGQKIKDTYYSPEIFYRKPEKKLNANDIKKTWLLSFAGKWYPSELIMNLLIEVTTSGSLEMDER